MKNSVKDEQLAQWLKNVSQPKPSWDLEDRIMEKIQAYEKQKAFKINYLRFSWIFFGVGLILGSFVTIFWFSPTEFVFSVPTEKLIFPFQILVVFILLLLFNELFKTTFKGVKS